MDAAHLIGDRTDAANSGGDIGHIFQCASRKQRLEQPRRFVDFQPHSSTRSSRKLTYKPPSPSTRVIASTLIFARSSSSDSWDRRQCDHLLAKLGRIAVEAAEAPNRSVPVRIPSSSELMAEADEIRLSRRSKAAITTSIEGRTDRVATGVSHRTETRSPCGDHDADGAASFAIQTDAMQPASAGGGLPTATESLRSIDTG